MPVTFSSYRLGPGQRVSYETVPPPWDWLLRRENELEPRRSRSQIIFAVLVPPLYIAVQAPALIVTCCLPRTWHFSRSTQVHSTQFRNEDSTHGTGGRFDPFLSTHFRSPDREAIVVEAGLCDGEGERAYIAYIMRDVSANFLA